MDSYNHKYLYDIIDKCTQSEFAQVSTTQIKGAYGSIGFKATNKKKDEMINDIYRFLTSLLVRQEATNQLKDGFPLFNDKNELFQKNPNVKHLIDTCNQKIHI